MNSRAINFDTAYQLDFEDGIGWTTVPQVVSAKRALFDAMQAAASQWDWDKPIPHAEHQQTRMHQRDSIKNDAAVRVAADAYNREWAAAGLPHGRMPMAPPPSDCVLDAVMDAMRGRIWE